MARPGGAVQLDAPTHHVIDIAGGGGGSEASTSTATTHHDDAHFSGVDFDAETQHEGGEDAPAAASAAGWSNGSNSRNSSSFMRRGGDPRRQRRRSPLDSGLWISVELVLTVGQIVASVVVLCLSRDEHPRNPLFAWIVGYASGCVATLPLLYWRYYHSHCAREQDSTRINDHSGTLLSTSGINGGGGEDDQAAAGSSRGNLASWVMNNARLKVLVDYFKMAIDCFFAVWFVIGNVWIFGGHSSANEAPNLYRLCVVFLSFSFIGYAMPFILCATICCCLPCIISFLGVREDQTQTRGATSESIDALPTYKFKMKKKKSRGESNPAVGEGGVVAAGTEKERTISGEDAVCCICLAKYENNDELRELPCSHLFHKECVDKWLKINALCPLCKSEVGENVTGSVSGEDANQQRGESRVENGHVNASP